MPSPNSMRTENSSATTVPFSLSLHAKLRAVYLHIFAHIHIKDRFPSLIRVVCGPRGGSDSELAFQVAFVNCDDVIQEITPPIAAKKSLLTNRLMNTDQRECKCMKRAVRRESFTWSCVGS